MKRPNNAPSSFRNDADKKVTAAIERGSEEEGLRITMHDEHHVDSNLKNLTLVGTKG
jgi:hypothetical protein